MYIGLISVFFLRKIKILAYRFGEKLKQIGRVFSSWGELSVPRWDFTFFSEVLKRNRVEVEFQIGTKRFRGPAFAIYRDFFSTDRLIFKLNWIAMKDSFAIGEKGVWNYSGMCTFAIEKYSCPMKLPAGDVWFSFEGGYAIIFLGRDPEPNLLFQGTSDTPRVFTYF